MLKICVLAFIIIYIITQGGAIIMVDVKRINELAKKSREVGLTEEEKIEQQKLRRAYLDAIRANIISQLGDPEDYKKNKGGTKS